MGILGLQFWSCPDQSRLAATEPASRS